ncbi:oxygen-independent coproporphyrinogen III oxidase [Tenacibaculum jejuense]|uniref:Coproporphyrinogen-III oxidase n=1 Tax=Tenacibaculum jejuense TaxID=584609 RepID=A0A238U5M2_9FLAO|nr:oxygen-independent coproporphyrinogen III oxidase [Tenacibaculum jejuense]SNR14503.1 coproporphyrinogen III oxidase, SAM and NAD(P)H dependent, oxygen-independent [Tenacibaculum jejuense]
MKSLIQKYNIPGPRYTSYPTVPYWDATTFSKEKWLKNFKKSFEESNQAEGISLYIHLPFCESLCTFCACHKHITKRHEVEIPYIKTLIKEWELYREKMTQVPVIKEIHLGGGTPTFFASEQLKELINSILEGSQKHPDFEFSFEGHPNNTTKEQLETLYNLGFTRVSFGIQDYDSTVQKAIHRIQSFENVKQVTKWAREIGYTSVSHDLIFGLPFQTKESITDTILKTRELLPDRISFYSYAHVPWVKGVGQRGFSEEHLPKSDEKRALYELGKQMLTNIGYHEIGMDHFALPSDNLFKATTSQKLHRNFMGYTSSKTKLMIGLGMSAISDSWYGFAQNVKTVKEYQALVNNGEIPVFRGHILTDEDLVIRKHILNIMCHFSTNWKAKEMHFEALPKSIELLEEIASDNLIAIDSNSLNVAQEARPFIRNICMAFDVRLQRKKPETKLFSMTI